MDIFKSIRSAFRNSYTINRFHNDNTFQTIFTIRQRDRDLGSWSIDDDVIVSAPEDFVPNKVKLFADRLVDSHLNSLPWNGYYERTT